MTADKQLKAYIDRVLRLKEEQDALGDDIRDVYAEAKAEGYDKTVMGKLVAHLRKVLKQGDGAVAEAENIFDTYLQAYHRASGTTVATHAHEEDYDRETGEVFDINPRLAKQIVDGVQTEAGRNALIAAVDILIEREEAEEFQAKASDDNGATVPGEDDPADSVTGDASRSSRGDDSPASNSEIAPASHGEAEAHAPKDISLPVDDRSGDGANTGGDHVDDQRSAATQAGAIVNKAPAARVLRPHCQRPEMCGSGTRDHCWTCKKAIRESEAA